MTAPPTPTLRLAYEALVDIGPTESLGTGPAGERFIVPILGGTFEGPPLRDSTGTPPLRGSEETTPLRGVVLPGGADRQWLRPDGVKELDALYEMRTDDGFVITVRNRVVIDPHAADQPGGRYARSVVRLSVADGPHAWLNRRVFVGTLASLRPARETVRIGVWLVD